MKKSTFELELQEKKRADAQEQAKNLHAQIENAENRLKAITGDLDKTQKALDEARRAKREAEEAAAEAKRLAPQLRTGVEALRRERDNLEKRIEELRADEKKISSKSAELQTRCDGLDAQIEQNSQCLDELRAEQRVRDRVLATPEEALLELWQPVVPTGMYKEAAPPIDERAALDGVRSYLAADGLRFSDRVVEAFHTSLKVANYTPLLVLAGITDGAKDAVLAGEGVGRMRAPDAGVASVVGAGVSVVAVGRDTGQAGTLRACVRDGAGVPVVTGDAVAARGVVVYR